MEKKNCLVCKKTDEKEKYFDMFDEIGVQLKMSALVHKYCKLKVEKKNSIQDDQVICEQCLDNLTNALDEDAYEKQRNKKAVEAMMDHSAMVALLSSELKSTKAPAPLDKVMIQGTPIPFDDIETYNTDKTISLRSGFEFVICGEHDDDDDGKLPELFNADETVEGFVCIGDRTNE